MINTKKTELRTKPQLLPSKSLLNTAVLGYQEDYRPSLPKKNIIFTEEDSLITTVKTGFQHNDRPVPPNPVPIVCFPEKNEGSIIENISTGFGECKVVEVECPKPLYKSHLYKENYLGEFKEESEKELARTNLGVYGKTDIERIISLIIASDTSVFITKEEVDRKLSELNFVDSQLKALVNYAIPNNLFRL